MYWKLKQRELDDHEKLVSVLRQVEVVISALPIRQYLKQLNIIQAMKDAGTIKRFVPYEYGNEADRVTALPPFEAMLSNKRKIQRPTKAARLSYTFISTNSFAVYFVNYLLHPERKTTKSSYMEVKKQKVPLTNCYIHKY
ncbi:hypothetical protein SLEP1_g10987 [Rubroshorea leprosula]|uniref:NmrA-like domain-containing protein n=1 Tax=Rubroshorea leprosula TaxID=152421 RepID=A0AAV5I9W0_9ROSI|nr:hypothetical protein SLEP1_g10987 [Rubroshorea leprosula]